MLYFKDVNSNSLDYVLNHYALLLNQLAKNSQILYSFWETPEAGRKYNQVYVRFNTPLHSILHEACHFVCMPEKLRRLYHIDAAGSVIEENATCYLRILLSDHIKGFDRVLHMTDMDDWGYSFRLGSATAWFHQDAEDAKNWLQSHNIIDWYGNITWELRK